MKRVKIMLSAILVLAIVAGALAFKAKKLDGFCLYTTKTTTTAGGAITTICPLVTISPSYTIAVFPAGAIKQSVYTTTLEPCPAVTNLEKCTLELRTKPE